MDARPSIRLALPRYRPELLAKYIQKSSSATLGGRRRLRRPEKYLGVYTPHKLWSAITTEFPMPPASLCISFTGVVTEPELDDDEGYEVDPEEMLATIAAGGELKLEVSFDG